MAKTKKTTFNDERIRDPESQAHKTRREEQLRLREFYTLSSDDLDAIEDEEYETFEPLRKKSNRTY